MECRLKFIGFSIKLPAMRISASPTLAGVRSGSKGPTNVQHAIVSEHKNAIFAAS